MMNPMPELYLSWQLDPVLIGSLVTLATLYGLAAGPLRSRIAPGEAFPVTKAAYFYGAIALLYLVEGSPLHDLAERYSLTAHMVQHLGISYVAAPLMVWATPVWMLRPLFRHAQLGPVFKLLTNPLVAFGTFTLFFSFWHVPIIYDSALKNSTLHHSQHVLFLISSLMVWFPLMSKVPERPPLPYIAQLIYLFLLPVFQLPVFGTVTFADKVLYPTYANAIWTLGMPALHEQALAGAVMKVGGLFAFGIPFAYIFFRWYKEETRQGAAVAAFQEAQNPSKQGATP